MVSQRFLYSLPQELANIVVLKEYLDNIKGVFLCYANIFKPLWSHSTFWLEFNSLGSESLPKLGKKFCFLWGSNENEFQLPSSPCFPPCRPANFPKFLLFPPSDKKSINLHSCMFRIDSAALR